MKMPILQRLTLLLALFALVTTAGFAQPSSRRDADANTARKLEAAARQAFAGRSTQAKKMLDCNNDQTPPQIQCAQSGCLPDARVAYVTSWNGEPWGGNDNLVAMDAVFGSGNWDMLAMEDLDPAILFSTAYKAIFIEGSDYNAEIMAYFLDAYRTQLENWVASGGAAFLNAAPNTGANTIDLGFGAILNYGSFVNDAMVIAPAHPVFQTPNAISTGTINGGYFLHASVIDPNAQSLITDFSGNLVGLCVKNYGAGLVYLGGMTLPHFHSPQPDATNLRWNILANIGAFCQGSAQLNTAPGECSAKVEDASFDATATDDCILISLTHDFAAAPLNTTLAGAVLPAGLTAIVWTATDAAGNTSTCQSFIHVRESVPPTAVCPADITVTSDPGLCGAVVSFTLSGSDDCSANLQFSSTPASGAQFPIGATLVVGRAVDASYNLGTCSFVVNVVPGVEVCNGLDDDCNGYVDDNVSDINTFYLDADGDGYGTPAETVVAAGCNPPYGFSANALDCDDNNYYVQPGMYEYCDGIDNNCDGQIDEGVAPNWYVDADQDGYGDPGNYITTCVPPAGYVSNNGDCDDSNAYIHPGALEDCTNDTDENCDGILGDNNFSIQVTHSDVNCGSSPDGAISIELVPAQNYPVILWSNGTCCTKDLSNLSDGLYKVTVSNECGTTKTQTVTIQPSPEPPMLVALSGTPTLCYGSADGAITATPSDGCGGYTFHWSNGSTDASISGLGAGYYEVVVSDACGCTRSASFTINSNPEVLAYFSYIVPLLDGTYFVMITPYSGTAPFTFRRSVDANQYTLWSPSNGFMGVPAGDHVFEVKDANGCVFQMPVYLAPLAPQPIEGGENRNDAGKPGMSDLKIKLFPNPTAADLTLTLDKATAEDLTICVTDMNGRLLKSVQSPAGSTMQAIPAGELPAGMYLLQVMDGGKVLTVEQFVKQ